MPSHGQRKGSRWEIRLLFCQAQLVSPRLGIGKAELRKNTYKQQEEWAEDLDRSPFTRKTGLDDRKYKALLQNYEEA